MTDVWVCATCHSLNRQRNARCYKCGAKQVEAATGALADNRTKLALQQRTRVRYRSSLLRALIASGFIIVVAVLNLVVLVLSLDAVRFLRDEIPTILGTGELDTAELLRRSAPAIAPGFALQICSLIALVAFAAWLSRVIANVPALGGGTPGATPTKAFIYPLIPVVNLIKVPPMIQDALYRLDPKAGGFFMILIAWVGLVGSALARFVFDNWLNLRTASIVRNAPTIATAIDEFTQAVDLSILVNVVLTVLVSIGAVVLVLVIFRVEVRGAGPGPRDPGGRRGPGRRGARCPSRRRRPRLLRARSPPAPMAASPALGGGRARRRMAPSPHRRPSPSPRRRPRPCGTARHGRSAARRDRPAPMASAPGVDDSPPEPSSIDELRAAAPALARAGGSAIVTAGPGGDPATVGVIVDALRAAGVPTQER